MQKAMARKGFLWGVILIILLTVFFSCENDLGQNDSSLVSGPSTGGPSTTPPEVIVTPPTLPTDTTAPSLSSGSVNRTSDTAATIGFTTNEAGTAYYLVQNSGAANPANTAVKAGTSLGAVSGTVSGKTVTLTAGAKDIYVVVVDSSNNISAPLKIAAAAYVPPLPAITDASKLLGYVWFKYKNEDFKYVFKNNGTVSVLHCCDLEFTDQFSYLYYGGTLITYGTDDDGNNRDAGFMIQTVNPLSNNNLTLTIGSGNEKDFYRGSATGKFTFNRGNVPYAQYPQTGYGNSNYTVSNSSPTEPLVLSNSLLGTWGTGSTEYKFSSNAELLIAGVQYVYLVRRDRLVTYGPTNGTKVAKEYTFTRSGNSLTLKPTSGSTITLSLK
jgi:hypothetical protein